MDLRELQASFREKEQKVLFCIPIAKLKRGLYFGMLNDDDMRGIWDILETTDTISTKQKNRFGIKRR